MGVRSGSGVLVLPDPESGRFAHLPQHSLMAMLWKLSFGLLASMAVAQASAGAPEEGGRRVGQDGGSFEVHGL
ncbi:hypothetical protein AK812_SmicGene6923 [Symbiodinium microadriaticum]|uniref:Uncharacterized protein n=1 Tax=Symbiodinium microadriaticum TaxID=2951 RepID=A0A1Q9EPW5_SYMMI|nr:hypothetical protein AK812_SmicGene6923 [Symbiodinium microadriaticum]